MNRAALCIRMLKILKSRDIVSSYELADLLHTNPRNIREFKKELEAAGYKIGEKRGRYGGYYLDDSTLMPIPKLEEKEMRTLAHIRDFLKVHPEFSEQNESELLLDSIIASAKSTENPDLPSVDFSFSSSGRKGLTEKENEFLSKAMEAMKARRTILMLYQGRNRDKPTPVLVDPYHIINVEDAWYLIGWSHSAQDFRNYRFSDERMDNIEVLPETFIRDKNFHFENYIGMTSAFKGKVDLYEVSVRKETERLFREDFKGKDLEAKGEKDGWVQYTFTADNPYQVYAQLFRFGSGVRLDAPAIRREDFVTIIRSILKNYEGQEEKA